MTGLRRSVAFLAAWVTALLLLSAVPAVADDSQQYVAVQTPAGLLLIVVIAVGIPLLVDIVTKRVASAAVKSTVLLGLSLLSGIALEWLNALNAGQPYDVVTALTTAAVTFLLSVGTFFGLTSPIGLAGRDGVVSKAVPGGIGSGRHAAAE